MIERLRQEHNEQMRACLATGFGAGHNVTRCGPGSLPKNAQHAANAISAVVAEYEVKSVNNAGCGDEVWIQPLPGYKGYDLENGFDITIDVMPRCDLIICRDVFIHMRAELILAALKLFDAKLLLATTHNDSYGLYETRPYNRHTNLAGEPFNLNEVKRYPDGDHWLGLYWL
jgi:hypothetical protein